MGRDHQVTSAASLTVHGMDCASCVSHVEQALGKLPGVQSVQVNLATARARVTFDSARVTIEQLAKSSTDAGYPAAPLDESARRSNHAVDHARGWRNRAVVGLTLWLPVEVLHWSLVLIGKPKFHGQTDWMTWLAFGASTVAMAYIGLAFARSAVRGLLRKQINMDVLITIGGFTSYFYSLTCLAGHLAGWWTMPQNVYFMEGAALMALISLGHYLEWRARDRASLAIRSLMDLAPDTASRVVNYRPPSSRKRLSLTVADQPDETKLEEVPSCDLVQGDLILVKPGTRVAADGVVVDGISGVDESMLSGEPLPVTRKPGDSVFGGTINRDGSLTVRVTRGASESALAQIVRMVEDAQNAKPPVQRIADNIAAVFVPIVLLIALLTGCGWYLWAQFNGWGDAQTWAMIAKCVCSVLIIACPCALGIALPAALMVGTGAAAKRGIVFKNLAALQAAQKVDMVVLDKTGTITRGRPVVARVMPHDNVDSIELLTLAASAEMFSEHPLAKAIVRHAKEQNLRLTPPSQFQNAAGRGVDAVVNGKHLRVGSAEFVGISTIDHDALSTSHVAIVQPTPQGDQTQYLGAIQFADEVKPESADAIRQLRQQGVSLLMLSGDTEQSAHAIGQQVGLGEHEIRGRLQPGDKEQVVCQLQAEGRVVAMVGDGINDAPALSRADLGIAIGSGSDIAKESGGIVLVGNSLCGVPTSLRVGKKTMRVIYQNFFWAFAYNIVAIPLAVLGFLTPLIAAAAMMLSDLTVIGNALRLRRAAHPVKGNAPPFATGSHIDCPST